MADDNSVTDFISAVCSIIAAVFGLVTVVTVVVAVRQLLTEHRAYASGLSHQALGLWKYKVRTRRLLGLQQEISTPTVTVPSLLKANWTPQFVFPGTNCTDPEKALAKASWVNFLTAIGVTPSDKTFYQMNAQPNLVNGIVPMRWEGKDFVAICSLLGFQSAEKRPSYKEPMKLPMQWVGPLGYLQFREGPNGCIVEFRRRALISDQIKREVHDVFASHRQVTQEHCLVAKLWRSINGMMIDNKKALYLGGTDERSQRRAKRLGEGDNRENSNESRLNFDDLMEGKTGSSSKKPDNSTTSTKVATPEVSANASTTDTFMKRRKDDDFFDELMNSSSKEDIVKKVQSHSSRKRKDKPKWEAELDAELGGLRDLLHRMEERNLGKMMVFLPCEGLLSVVATGELANSRGLSIGDCAEYCRAYFDYDDINLTATPYRLGDLFMDEDLLKLVKDAMKFLKPDGFYFTPTMWLAQDIGEIYEHVYYLCEDSKNEDAIFPTLALEDWPTDFRARESLHNTILLCNNLQHIRQHGRAQFTIGDMVVIGKASRSLPKVDDLVWSMLVSPDLFKDLHRAFNRSAEEFKSLKAWDFLNVRVTCRNGILDCTELMRRCGLSRDNDIKYATAGSTPMDYTVPLCKDSTFEGWQVLASFLDVLVTHFWIQSRWITDVESYDHVIPQTIIMC